MLATPSHFTSFTVLPCNAQDVASPLSNAGFILRQLPSSPLNQRPALPRCSCTLVNLSSLLQIDLRDQSRHFPLPFRVTLAFSHRLQLALMAHPKMVGAAALRLQACHRRPTFIILMHRFCPLVSALALISLLLSKLRFFYKRICREPPPASSPRRSPC
jgi:hypothetical protein